MDIPDPEGEARAADELLGNPTEREQAIQMDVLDRWAGYSPPSRQTSRNPSSRFPFRYSPGESPIEAPQTKHKKSFKDTVNQFFLGEGEFGNDPRWQTRSRRLHSKSHGVKMKEVPPATPGPGPSLDTLDAPDSVFDASFRSGSRRVPHPIDPLARRTQPGRMDSTGSRYYSRQYSRQASHLSTASSRRSQRLAPAPRTRKESVLHMAYDGVKTLMSTSERKTKRKPFVHSRSFAPQSISSYMEEMEILKRMKSPSGESMDEPPPIDEVFFDVATPTSHLVSPFAKLTSATQQLTDNLDRSETSLAPIPEQRLGPGADDSHLAPHELPQQPESPQPAVAAAAKVKVEFDDESPTGTAEHGAERRSLVTPRPTSGGWQSGRRRPLPLPGTPEDDLDAPFSITEAWDVTLSQFYSDNSDRRAVGLGFVGKFCGREYREENIDERIQKQLEAMIEYRPYFTYWMTFVQIVIFVFSVAVYGFAPVGWDKAEVSAEVLKPNLAIEKVLYYEKANLWIGPRQADLIHLGAKYSPCMRRDENIESALLGDKRRENATACCIRNDGSGCMQAAQDQCSSVLSSWYKWTPAAPGFEGRESGSVCGQDPKYCTDPASSAPFVWPDDITEWPLCAASASVPRTRENQHMTCQITGRPCCVGIQGECLITSREFCEFRKGYFHEEATLCSQVSCMSEICGMIPFLDPDRPDQFYRLWTTLFLHAGVVQLLVTVLYQFFIMRDLEKLAGWHRIAIIYIGSGIGGSLASAIFLPYHVEAGPAGSQFGLLACLFVELLQNWHIIKNPGLALAKQLAVLFFLFLFGLLPYVDNYAHLIGFLFGFMLAFALLPNVTFNMVDRRGKIIGIVACLFLSIGMFALLVVFFYVAPIYNCPNCHYFTCLPLTPNFCESMEVKVERTEKF